MVVIIEDFTECIGETLGVFQITKAKSASCNLILVGWANTSASRPNFFLTALGLTRLIQRNVVRQNQWAGRRDLKPFTNRNATRLQLVNLFQ